MKHILQAAVQRVTATAPMVKGKPIISFDYRDKQLQLFHANGKPVKKGEVISHAREGEEPENYTITNGQAPHRAGTEGRVYFLRDGATVENTLYTSVFDMEWKPAVVKLKDGDDSTATKPSVNKRER